jgi:16S rRNA (cytosine1402-N4)-methyltransferase
MPDFFHTPVLLRAVLDGLQPRAGGRYVDMTVGGGGHAAAILEASAPDGTLVGVDRDPAALAAARQRLARYGGRVELREGAFDRLGEWVAPGSCDGMVADLGVSSPQLDTPERGFSFQHEGPLDMRLAGAGGPTAADLVNRLPVEELARLFAELGDEPRARAIARAIGRAREQAPLVTTRQLAELVARVAPRPGRATHPATRVFLALRLAVNDELGVLERGLVAAWRALRPGGRLAVITFHGGEVRVVRRFVRERERAYEVPPGQADVPELRRPCPPRLRRVTRRPVTPGTDELAANPRARSAQLWLMEKLAD